MNLYEAQRAARKDAADRFRRSTEHHQMTVLHDEGLYRHLRFRAERSMYWFDLITWPGTLAIRGDINHGFMFTRITDMFEFFRGDSINPDYWAEKTEGGIDSCRSYSVDLLNLLVAEELAEAEKSWPGVTQAWTEKTTGFWAEVNLEYEYEARQALDDFEFGTVFNSTCSCGSTESHSEQSAADTWRFVAHLGKGHNVTAERVEGFRFYDTSDWMLRDYDWSYLWACHAIQWGIKQYDAVKAPVPAGEAS